MSIDHRNLHRLAVTSGDRFVGILTQSRIVRKFSLHISDFNFGNQYIRDLNLGIKPVVTVNENDTVTDAINCICKNKISGVGIIDKDGKLIGNFSAIDIKSFGYTSTLEDLRNVSLKTFADDQGRKPISVKRTSKAKEVVALASNNGVHRVYVVNDAGQPIGVISLGDIIDLFFTHILIE
eukprot:TRINITY_DN3973_c0_g2_i16.p1 TRINITY_DN3973_c0_g2~~TRINITY_DN3973_c0_g2_i16.p1  ORF type:complete len:180 (-),score=39.43 TRINITY_DN3973_c0_g2_i16:563-1102(-)